MRGELIQTALLLAAHCVQRIFFVNGFVEGPDRGAPECAIGQVNGFMREGAPVPFRWSQLTEPGTLSLLALLTLALTLVLAILFRNGGIARGRRNRKILGALAVLSLVAYPLLATWIQPHLAAARADGRHLDVFLLAMLTCRFGLFPYLAFAFVGAIIGLRLAEGRPAAVRRSGLRLGWSYVVAAALAAGILLVTRVPVGRASPTTGAVAAVLGLGVFTLLLTRSLSLWHFAPSPLKDRRLARHLWLRRFGRLSLTVYILEPVLAEVLGRGFTIVAGPQWQDSLAAVLLLSLCCVLLWNTILRLWQHVGYIGSLERLMGVAIERLGGVRTSRTDLSDLAPTRDAPTQ